MSQPDFSGIVKNICYGIKGNRSRAEAEEELMGHLEDTYERNIAIGKSEEDAFNASVASLGNTKLLAQQLEAVHAHSPAAQMKSAIWIFVIGFVLQKFHLNLFDGMSLITDFIGMLCWLFSLYLMRKANKNLRIAYYSYSILFLLSVVNNCITSYGINNDIFNYAYLITYHILLAIMLICAISGFMTMDKTYCYDSEKRKPHLGFALVYMPFEVAVAGVISVMSYGESLNSENPILFIIMVVIYIFIIAQFVRLKNRLWDADARYGIDSLSRKNVPILCMVVTLSIILPMCCMYGYAVKDTDKTQLVIHDTDNQTEADAIREHMAELGVDAETLNMLPDSEIMNYKDAVNMTFCGEGYADGYVDCMIFDFYFIDENDKNECSMRSLYVLNLSDCKYRMGFYYFNFDDSYSHIVPSDEKDVYVSILHKQGNKYYAKKPINYSFDLFDNLSSVPNGFDFKAENDQTVIFAMNYNIPDCRMNFSMNQGVLFVSQRIPFSFVFNTVEQAAIVSGNYNFHSYSNHNDMFMKSYICRDGTIFEPGIVGQTYYQADEFY
ncbi:MAG: hypothetical protein IJZ35_09335 [Clostridia bacterium]|nr:hypothetical protein [Clostridia bacterium]